MKKIYLTLAAGVFTLTAAAQQQLPNAGFEDGWGACIPWTSTGNNDTFTPKGASQNVQTPGNWTISHVIGMKFLGKWMGSTAVGEATEGYNSNKAVKVYNSSNSALNTQIVPGYFTLGTTWSTAKGMGNNPDGGSFGGVAFSNRPESITFMYKRTHGGESTEPATVVAYLWKGTFKQIDVPGNIDMSKPTTCTMTNRDRNILGMSTSQGGEVTEKGTLIAKIDYKIEGDATEWTECTIPFEYVSDETPEMINVIFSAGDYWSTSPEVDNALYIDDVKLNYPAEKTVTDYKGKLEIIMLDSPVNPDDNTQYIVSITDLGNNTCDIKLADFGLANLDLKLGDINIYGVTMTEEADGSIKYSGSTEGLKLIPEGGTDEDALICNVTCEGTSKGDALSMKIPVEWVNGGNVIIDVTFNGTKTTSGIGIIESDDSNAPVEYYNLNGQRVVNPSGLVIRRQGNTVTKVIVK